MKAKVIVTAAMLVVGGMASAQEDSKYYMNVETAPDKVQSYEVNPDLKVSWEPTRKGANPSGYYTKDEVDKMLQNLVDYYKLESLTIGLTDEDGEHDYGLIDKSREINYLLWGRRAMDSVEADVIWGIVPDKGSILERLDNHQRYLEEISELLTGYREGWGRLGPYMADFPYGVLEYLVSGVRSKAKTASIPANAEVVSSDETLEENKVLKDNVEDMQKEIEKLKKEKEDLSKQMNDLMGRIEALEKK